MIDIGAVTQVSETNGAQRGFVVSLCGKIVLAKLAKVRLNLRSRGRDMSHVFVLTSCLILIRLEGIPLAHSVGHWYRTKELWEWGSDQQHAFDTIIVKLTSPPVLAYAEFTKPFLVTTDASSYGLGAVLYQYQDGH